MKIGKWAWLLLAAVPLLAGCGDFWQSPYGSSSTSFTLSNSGDITVSPGSTGTSTITVTPSNSFTGTVSLTCAITSAPSSASSPTTCSLSPTSVDISSTSAQTSTLTADTTASTTTGAYDITVTGTSGSVAETTTLCAEVTTSSGSCTTTAGTSGDFYILNAGTPQIVGESIVSGTLTAISGSPWTAPATPNAMAISPNGKLLFVSTNAGVYVYPITSGALGSATQVTTDETALALRVDATGDWLLEAVQASGAVTVGAVPINSSTGAATGTEQSQSFTNANASVQYNEMAISPDNDNVFIALGTGGTIVVPFNAGVSAGSNPLGGSATAIPVVTSGGSALSVAVDPTNRLFYIGETLANSGGTAGGLRAFVYSSLGGTLTQATGSPITSGGLAPNVILPSANGSYVYVGNGQGTSSAGNITSFAVTGSSPYTIATGSTVATGTQPYGLAEDSTGSYVLAVNYLGNPYFDSYTFDGTTAGKLDSQITANTGSSPLTVVAAP
jgi:6-phosphogluconolactonase (cycloisomerase 2 family)